MSVENINDRLPVIDQAALEELRLIMEDEFADILQVYLDDSISLMSEVHSGFNEQHDALLRAAHTLKSSSNNVGAKRLGDISERIERYVKGNDIESARMHLDELQDAFTDTHSHIKEYMEHQLNIVAT